MPLFSANEKDKILEHLRTRLNIKLESLTTEANKITIKHDKQYDHYFSFASLEKRNLSFAIKDDELKYDATIYVLKQLDERDSQAEEVRSQDFLSSTSDTLKAHVYRPISGTQENPSNKYLNKEYLVYPFVFGKTLDEFCKTLQSNEESFTQILKFASNICNTLEELELYNDHLRKLPKNQKEGGGPKNDMYIPEILEGIWDVNAGNMVVQDDHEVILIDFQPMRTAPHRAFISMIEMCFYSCAGEDFYRDPKPSLSTILKEKLKIDENVADNFLSLWNELKNDPKPTFSNIAKLLQEARNLRNSNKLQVR